MSNKAFTLIEIIIVAVILGVLAIMAIPNFSKTTNRSYAQDAMHNLIAIYGAEQNFSINHGETYLSCPTLACINDSNPDAGLGVGIVSPITAYVCTANTFPTPSPCTATRGTAFTMQIILNNPITVTSTPVYCNGTIHNPCCVLVAGAAAGDNCP